MAVLHQCSCSNPFCDVQYAFTSNGTGLSRESYWKYHKIITRDIACGKYGEELQRKMQLPDSVFLDTSSAYSYCAHCDEIHFGGKIVVYLHKEGKCAELQYDNWNESYHLSGINSKQDYEEILRIAIPCWHCGGKLQHLESFFEMRCPKCRWPMKNGEPGAFKKRFKPRPKRRMSNMEKDDCEEPVEQIAPAECDDADVICKEYVRRDGTRIVGYYDRKKNIGWTESFDANGAQIEKKMGTIWAKAVIACAENDQEPENDMEN